MVNDFPKKPKQPLKPKLKEVGDDPQAMRMKMARMTLISGVGT
jgi:hypothetical protein